MSKIHAASKFFSTPPARSPSKTITSAAKEEAGESKATKLAGKQQIVHPKNDGDARHSAYNEPNRSRKQDQQTGIEIISPAGRRAIQEKQQQAGTYSKIGCFY